MQSRQIVLKGLAIRYYSREPDRPGPLPAVIFLHGWRSEGKVWQQAMERLAKEGIPSFALDLPGFGGSETPSRPWTLGDYCSLVGEFVAKTGLPRAALVGHSFGGRVAIKLAAQDPGWLEKLLLAGSHGFRDTSLMRQVKLAAAKVLKPLFALPPLRPLRRKIYSWMGAEDYVATPSLKNTFVNVINEDLQECMPLIRKPVCLVWGSDDKATPVSFGRRMEALMPDARLRILAGAGHYSFLDRPGEFGDMLLSFLNQ